MPTRGPRKLSKKALYELAREHGIPNRSRMTKADLLVALRACGVGVSPEGEPTETPARSSSAAPPRADLVGAAGAAVSPFVDWGSPLPLGYGRDRIVALARDPFWLFVYWEFEGPARDALAARLGRDDLSEVPWFLRARNLTKGSEQEVAVSGDSYSWYLRVEDDCTFEIDLGVRLDPGAFVVAITSGSVRTPRAALSEDPGETWMVVEGTRKHSVSAPAEAGSIAAARQLASGIVHSPAGETASSGRHPVSTPR